MRTNEVRGIYISIEVNHMFASINALEFPFKSYVSVLYIEVQIVSKVHLHTCINTSDQQFAVIYSETSTLCAIIFHTIQR